MSDYKIISYDVWGNGEDGYEVMAEYYTNIVVEIDDPDDDDEVIRSLIEADYLSEAAAVYGVAIDGDETNMYLEDPKDGQPLCRLCRTDSC